MLKLVTENICIPIKYKLMESILQKYIYTFLSNYNYLKKNIKIEKIYVC